MNFFTDRDDKMLEKKLFLHPVLEAANKSNLNKHLP
jgi:hypothetical protein